jgi:hypothetical protein
MTHHYDGEYRQSQEEKPIIERFRIGTNEPFPSLHVFLDDKEISVEQLINISNQLASALNDRGCYFEVKK